MSFDVAATAYGRFMGQFAESLATRFADVLDLRRGQRALDVGAGPGALTTVLVGRLGASAVSAVEPSPPFAAALAERLPGIAVERAPAEALPFAADSFDVVAAQLVVHFMTDPVAGIAEMARVARPNGRVAACVWDHAGGTGPVSLFWRAARELDPDADDESALAGARDGHLVELFTRAGLVDAEQHLLTVDAPYTDVDAWWETYTLGVGPAGAYVAQLDEDKRVALRARCAALLPAGPFVVTANAWAAVATVGQGGS
jgi:SAM-dependent methyltransferase